MTMQGFYLTEKPTCEETVIDMSYMYHGRVNLIGSPVCGPNVTNMDYSYCHCNNLVGDPVCGQNVITMNGTYYGCTNLNGCATCGPNVIHMSSTYTNCVNLAENAYFHSPNIEYVGGCFAGKDKSKRLNIYVPADSVTLSSCISEDYAFSLVSQQMIWAYNQNENYYVNDLYNIRVYPINNITQKRIDNGDE